MIKMFVAACLALLSACAQLPPPVPAASVPIAVAVADSTLPPPAAIADLTTADEKTALAIEIAYKAVGSLYEAALDSRRLSVAAVARADALDAQAHDLVRAARAAYDAGNAASYGDAVERAGPLIERLRRVVTGQEPVR